MNSITSRTVLIVVGTHPLCEYFDRPLAYILRDTVARRHSDLELPGLVISDVCYFNNPTLWTKPLISVGGPGVNALTAELRTKLFTDSISTPYMFIQHDIHEGGCNVALWGVDEVHTEKAVHLFIQSGLIDKFLRVARNYPLPPPEPPTSL